MARAARAALGSELEGGLVVVPDTTEIPADPPVAFKFGNHPHPDAQSVLAGEALLSTAATLPDSASVLVLLAGGGSALAVAPVAGLALRDKIAAHRELLRAGLPIQTINAVRSHLSRIKGGGLLKAIARSPALGRTRPRGRPLVRVEILSDIAGGEIEAVAAGPCSPDPSTFSDCLEVVKGLHRFPEEARRCLIEGARGERPETLKPGDAILGGVAYHRLAGPGDLLAAAAVEARHRGLEVDVDEQAWQLGVSQAVARMERWLTGPSRARLLAAVGEVQLALPTSPGTGGRAQHLVLAMAPLLEEHRASLLVAGSDGHDGNSPFAGATAESDLAIRAERAGLDIAAALVRCDASTVISALGLGIPAAPATTNLTDLVLLARHG
jgi:hydroxypyruvate reductase